MKTSMMRLFSFLILTAFVIIYTGCTATGSMSGIEEQTVTISDSLSKEIALDHYLSASVHEESDELYEAAVEYQLALLYNPFEPAVIVGLAQVYLKLGKFDAALMVLEKGWNDKVKDEELLKLLANLYLQKGMAEQVVFCYDDLREIRPLEELELLRLAALLSSLDRYDDALDIYREYLDRFGESTEIYHKIGLTYLNLQDINSAQEAFLKLVELDPSAHRVQFVLGGFAVSRLDWETAEKYFRNALNADSTDIRYWTNLIMVLEQQEKFTEVVRVASSALIEYPEFPPLFDIMGGAYERLKMYEEAISAFKQSYSIDSNRVAPLLSIGFVYHTLEEWDEAAAAYEKALEINPEHAMVLNNYAYMLSVQNHRLEDALSMSEHALQLEPETSSFLDTRGWIYYRMGRYEEALADLNSALKDGKKNPELFEHLGYIYEAMGDSKKARDAWKKAVELDPDNEKYARLVE